MGSAVTGNNSKEENTLREIPLEPRLPGVPEYAGQTLTEMMWDLIDQRMEILMDGNRWSGKEEHAEHVGYLRGAAEMLAVFLNPYRPDLDSIRDLALLRWEYRHYESEVWQ